MTESDHNEIRRAVEALFPEDGIVEIRAFRGRKAASGYFDNHEAFIRNAAKLDREGWAVYMTLNLVDAALLARAANRIEEYPKSTTSDGDIVRLRRLPLDFDPVRPSNVSATRPEHRAAEARAFEVRQHLRSCGWPDPLVGDSGNGFHLVYEIDFPNTKENIQLVKETLEALAFKFDDDKVKIDTGVYNPARIWKLYGTTARKGDSVAERPHRRSKIIKVPEEEAHEEG